MLSSKMGTIQSVSLRTPKTHESNTRCVTHFTKAFGDQ
jgi:hypothetical protein